MDTMPPGSDGEGQARTDDLISRYFALQQEIYAHFGYVEDWRVIPLDDQRSVFWYLSGTGAGDEVVWATDRDNLDAHVNGPADTVDGDDLYSAEVYTQRHLPRWVYPADDYTMVCVDTNTDGNKFLMVFDNAKRVTARPADV